MSRPRLRAAIVYGGNSKPSISDRAGCPLWVMVPNATLCTDGQLARVGFMDPKAVEGFVNDLQSHGFVFLSQGKCVDIAVVEQQRGPTEPCEWLEFAQIPFGKEGKRIAACWFLISQGWLPVCMYRD